eukprot:Amastigsp_a842664_10.p4 type:complete len:116 gc:universal Amastigsp_a842664_10:638-985(+)
MKSSTHRRPPCLCSPKLSWPHLSSFSCPCRSTCPSTRTYRAGCGHTQACCHRTAQRAEQSKRGWQRYLGLDQSHVAQQSKPPSGIRHGSTHETSSRAHRDCDGDVSPKCTRLRHR